MKKQILTLIVVLCFLLAKTINARGLNPDSLLNLLKGAKEDTSKVYLLNQLSSALYFVNPDSTILLADQAAKLSQKINFKRGEGDAFHNLGIGHYMKGDYPNAIEAYLKAIDIRERIGQKKEIGNDLGNIALIYTDQGDYVKSLEYNLRALKIAEETGNKRLQGNTLGNIGNVYLNQKEYDKALEYCFRSVKISTEMNSKQSIASTYSNIGIIYNDKKEFEKAMEYYTKALKMDEELGNQNEMAINYMNMGILQYDLKNYEKALACYSKSQAISEATGNKSYIAIGHANVGSVYTDMGKIAEAEKHLLKALEMDKEIESLDDQRQVQELLSKMYEKSGREKLALEAYRSAALLKDSVYTLEKNKEMTRKEMNFEFERKETLAKAEQDKKDALTAEEKEKQRIIIYSVIGVLLLVVVFSVSLFNRFRVTKKQKAVIEEQKLLVDEAYEKLHEKNKEVIDSIHYAQRIQKALITSEHYISKNMQRLMSN